MCRSRDGAWHRAGVRIEMEPGTMWIVHHTFVTVF